MQPASRRAFLSTLMTAPAVIAAGADTLIAGSAVFGAPDYAAAIAALPGRKLILTNGSREHALRTAEKLGLHEMFEDVFETLPWHLKEQSEQAMAERRIKWPEWREHEA